MIKNEINLSSYITTYRFYTEEFHCQELEEKISFLVEQGKKQGIHLPATKESYTSLQTALILGGQERWHALIREGQNINEPGPCGYPCVVLAILLGYHQGMIEELFLASAAEGQGTALFLLGQMNSTLCISLWALAKKEVRAALLFSKMAASFSEKIEKVFYEEWEDVFAEFRDEGFCGKSFLLHAIDLDKLTIASQLFDKEDKAHQFLALEYCLECPEKFIRLWERAPDDIKNGTNKFGHSWLNVAIISRNNRLISYFLDQKVSVNTLDYLGYTPLRLATHSTAYKEIDRQLIRKLWTRDEGFTADMERCKLFGERYSLEGVLFEGINCEHVSTVSKSMVENLKRNIFGLEKFSDGEIKEITEIFHESKDSDAEKILERAKRRFTFMSCGWDQHCIGVIFSTKIFVKIDTGTGEDRGARFYTIGNKDEKALLISITTLLENTKQNVPMENGSLYMNHTIDKQLGLQYICYLSDSQTVGNCTSRMYRAAMHTLFILKEWERSATSLGVEPLKTAACNVSRDFISWDSCDRIVMLQEAISAMKQHSQYFSIPIVLSNAIKSCFNDNRELPIIEILKIEPSLISWQDPETEKTLAQLADENNFFALKSFIENKFN